MRLLAAQRAVLNEIDERACHGRLIILSIRLIDF